MFKHLLQGLEKGITDELVHITNKFFSLVRKRFFSILLQAIVFTAAAIFLILGFILFAANFLAIEYVLLLFGFALFIAFMLGSRK